MKRYLHFLQEEPVVRRLTLIQLIAYFGAWFSNVAIYTLLVDLGVSASIIALVAALHFLPGVIQAPLTGVIIDKFHPKLLMFFLLLTEIIATLLLLLVVDVTYLWLLFTVIIVRMSAASFYFTVEMSLLPKLLTAQKLQDANTLHSMVWSVSYTAGMAISGFVVHWFGVYLAFAFDALLFMVALLLLWSLYIDVERKTTQHHFLQDLKDGIKYIKQKPVVGYIIILHAFVGLTAFDALVALLAKYHFSRIIAVPLAIGFIHAIRALALVVGPMVLAPIMSARVLYYLLWFQGLTIVIWALYIENFYYSLVMSFVVGLSTTTLWSYTYTLLQNYTDKAYYGRVIAYNDMLFLFTSGMLSLGIGWMYDAGMSLLMITLLIGVGFILGAMYYSWLRKRYLDV